MSEPFVSSPNSLPMTQIKRLKLCVNDTPWPRCDLCANPNVLLDVECLDSERQLHGGIELQNV